MRKKLKNKKIIIVGAAAGFPSPAENYIEENLDIGKYLVNNIESTFFVRVSGDSMINVGIYNNDIMVVDKSLTPKNQSIVVASLNGELIIKKFYLQKITPLLLTSYIFQLIFLHSVEVLSFSFYH